MLAPIVVALALSATQYDVDIPLAVKRTMAVRQEILTIKTNDKKLRKKIEEVRQGERVPAPDLIPKPGQIGWIRGGKVVRVLGESKMIVRAIRPDVEGADSEYEILVDGRSTKNLADDSLLDEEHEWYAITGKEMVDDRTYMLATPFDPGAVAKLYQQTIRKELDAEADAEMAHDEAWQKMLDEMREKKKAAIPAPRQWLAGEAAFTATLAGVIGGQAKLIREDKTTIKVPLNELSDEDRVYIKSRSK